MSDPTITLLSVGKRYEIAGAAGESGDWAVKNLSLSVFPGEVTVLMGPSGSGKTTVLSMIGGLIALTKGQMNVLGKNLEQCNEEELQQFRRNKIGFVFQNFNLLSSLTARENIEIALALRNDKTTSAMDLLASVGLAEKANAYPSMLSGGQRQRVGVARALAGSPPILLADEPTAALDADHARIVMKMLRKRAKSDGITVLVVTHDSRVRKSSDRVIEMEDGELKRIVRRVRYPERSTARFLPGGASRSIGTLSEVRHAAN